MRFEYQVYRRPFRQPLQTSHGLWSARVGIVIQLDQHPGEIAPIPWLGTETLEEALAWCRSLPEDLDPEQIAAIPDQLPACQFGFESALAASVAGHAGEDGEQLPQSALLPTGEAALTNWPDRWAAGYRTFKWKIGVQPIALEQQWLQQLVQQLPPEARLRLDANGGLSLPEADHWLTLCDRYEVIEFLEQPLPPTQFAALCALAANHSTPLALDESVTTVAQMQACYDQGWPGLYVIKPAIAGFPSRLRQFWVQSAIAAVFSSALETAVGRRAALQLATEFPGPLRAVGFGVEQFFQGGAV